jgi:hypothetical protein
LLVESGLEVLESQSELQDVDVREIALADIAGCWARWLG